MSLRHLIDLNDFSTTEWDEILRLGSDIIQDPSRYSEICKGKILATIFYEPSTRTQMSFQAAMLRLGGQVIGFDNPVNSSVAKGESLWDTAKIVGGYSDIIAIRHPAEGSARAASEHAGCPLINAGDGGHLHPTQTLTDMMTLRERKGRLGSLTIGICGDLKNGRTVHSLVKAMSRYRDNRFVLISTKELRLPKYIKEKLRESGCRYDEVETIDEAIGELDILYMTRIQRERFSSKEEYEQQKNIYVLDTQKMSHARADLAVLHPLPRVDEITVSVDDDPRALYFDQAKYGMYVRMALIIKMLDNDWPVTGPAEDFINPEISCLNPRCITHKEIYLPHLHKEQGGAYVCGYCEHKFK